MTDFQYTAVYAACACTLACLLGSWLAAAVHRRALARHGWLDTATGMGNRDALVPVGQPLLDKARAARRPFSVVVLDFSELAEVREIYGRETTQRVIARVVERVEALAGPRGVALRTGAAQFTVLLPGSAQEAAGARIWRALGKPCRVEFEAGDSEIVLVPEIAAENVAADDATVDEVWRDLAQGLARDRRLEQRRQQWLQRERERHSRPMAFAA